MRVIDPRIVGKCDGGGDCDRWAVSLAFDHDAGLVPVCRRHITVYQVLKDTRWQAEDEFADLRFCRRSRFKWLAQRRILHDQRAAMNGRRSRAQERRWRNARPLTDFMFDDLERRQG